MKKYIKKIALYIIVIIFVLNIQIPTQAAEEVNYGDKLQDLMEFVSANYYGDAKGKTMEDLYNDALNGIFSKLDPYSAITKLSDNNFLTSLESSYVGIGSYLKLTPTGVAIESVIDNSPAKAAGLLPGDIIIKVEGIDVTKKSLEEVAKVVKGVEGTSVKILFQRGSNRFEKVIIRKKIELSSITSFDLKTINPLVSEAINQKALYIQITSINENAYELLVPKLMRAKDQGKQYIILDLRSNGGGYLDQAIDICKILTPKGTILKLEKKDGSTYSFNSELTTTPFKLIVLVNKQSASAAEIIAGAIQKSGAGVLVGQTTYGKGVAQTIFYYDHTYQIKLTDTRFLFRDNSYIQGIGLKPNYEIIHAKDEAPTVGDLELKKAIEIIEKGQF